MLSKLHVAFPELWENHKRDEARNHKNNQNCPEQNFPWAFLSASRGQRLFFRNIRGFARIIRFFGCLGKRDISKLHIFPVCCFGLCPYFLCFGRFGYRLVVVINDGCRIFFGNFFGGRGSRRGNSWWNGRVNDRGNVRGKGLGSGRGSSRFKCQSCGCFFSLCFFCENGENLLHDG